MSSEMQLVFVREDVESTLWWPAVLGSSHKNIVSTFSSEEEKARFTAMFFRQGWHDSNKTIARIFNYKKYPQRKMFLLVPDHEQPDLVRDFFGSCEEVGKTCNQIDGWNEAFFEALHNKIGHDDDDEVSSEPLFGSPGGALYAPESNTTVGRLEQNSTGKRKVGVESTNATMAASCQKKSRRDSRDEDKLTASSSSERSGEGDESFHTPISRSNCMQQQSPIPLDQQYNDAPQSKITLPEHSHNLIVSSGTRKKNAKKAKVPNSQKHQKRSIRKNDEWTTVWEILRETYGWVVRKGDGLAEQYYIPGELEHRNLNYIKKNCSLGKDYYASEEDVKRYVREKFLWEGPATKSLSRSQKKSSKAATNDKQTQGKKSGRRKKEPMEETYFEPEAVFKINPEDPWPTALSKIQFNLQLEYRTHVMMAKKKYHSMSPMLIRKNLTEFEDYFESEDKLKDFAFHTYGWKGPRGKEHVPVDIVNGGRRCKDYGNGDKKQSPTSSVASPDQASTSSTKVNGKRASSTKKQSNEIPSPEQLSNDSRKGKRSSPRRRANSSIVLEESNAVPGDVKVEEITSSDQSGTVAEKQDKKKSSSTRKKNPPQVSEETNEISGVDEPEGMTDVEHKEKDEELNKTLRDRLNNCTRNLRPTYVPIDMFFTGPDNDSKVARNENKLMSFLHGCLDIKQKQLDKESSLLYVCGGPGTGKTSMVKHCMEALEKDQNTECSHSYIKATDIERSPDTLIDTIGIMMGKKTAIKKVNQIEKWLTSGLKKGPIFLVIDEIDFLLNGVPSSDSIIANVLRWACDPNNRLAVIGISNSVGDDGAKILHEHFQVLDEIVFEPFSAEDLIAIVNKRLGEQNACLVDKNALLYASKRTANNRGDAREILQLMSDAFSLATESLTSDQLSDKSTVDSPIVKMPHVMKSLKKNGEYSKSVLIEGLPGNAKIILCVAAALGQVGSGWKIMRLSDLKSYCADATAVCEDFSLSVFDSAIEQLMDSGLISYDYSYDMFDGDNDEKCIKLGVHLHDVEVALEDTLLKEGSFYSNLVNYVKATEIVCSDEDDEWF